MLPTTPHTLLGLQYPLSSWPSQAPSPGTFPEAWALRVTPPPLSSVTPGFLYVPGLLGHCLLCHPLVTWLTQGSRRSYSLCVE